MCDYVPLFPELFVNIYYFGAALEPSLLRIWAKSKEFRSHTGLITMDRPDLQSDMMVKLFLYAPVASRPFGVQLPLVHTVCGCQVGKSEWVFKKEKGNEIEKAYFYISSCCGVQLEARIHPDQRREITNYQVRYIVEPWDIKKRCFTFNMSDNVGMEVQLEARIHPDQRREITNYQVRYIVEPWDIKKHSFTFNVSDNVGMEVQHANPNGKKPLAET
ncbi:hypothetical protein RSAG8_09743, partial [Rhizoctonia solani AG-8 WAC10335]